MIYGLSFILEPRVVLALVPGIYYHLMMWGMRIISKLSQFHSLSYVKVVLVNMLCH